MVSNGTRFHSSRATPPKQEVAALVKRKVIAGVVANTRSSEFDCSDSIVVSGRRELEVLDIVYWWLGSGSGIPDELRGERERRGVGGEDGKKKRLNI